MKGEKAGRLTYVEHTYNASVSGTTRDAPFVYLQHRGEAYMLNVEVLARLEALIAYCQEHEDGECDWPMLQHLLEAVRGAAGAGPELQHLYEAVRAYVDARLWEWWKEDRQQPHG